MAELGGALGARPVEPEVVVVATSLQAMWIANAYPHHDGGPRITSTFAGMQASCADLGRAVEGRRGLTRAMAEFAPRETQRSKEGDVHRIEVLGTGCPKCQATLRNAEQAVAELGVEAEIVKVEDLREIMARGVMMTPALAIDGEIVVSGHIAPVAEIKRHLEAKARG